MLTEAKSEIRCRLPASSLIVSESRSALMADVSRHVHRINNAVQYGYS